LAAASLGQLLLEFRDRVLGRGIRIEDPHREFRQGGSGGKLGRRRSTSSLRQYRVVVVPDLLLDSAEDESPGPNIGLWGQFPKRGDAQATVPEGGLKEVGGKRGVKVREVNPFPKLCLKVTVQLRGKSKYFN
jgi:hypothetical protein